MRAIFVLLFLLLAIANSLAGEPLIPALFHPRMRNDRYEQKIADCKKMSPEDIKDIHGWLKAGTWNEGQKAIPKVPEAGTFLFRETGTKRAWVISLLAATDALIVKEAVIGIGGFPISDFNSFKCVRHPRFAKLLELEVRRSFPEGSQRIDEEKDLRGSR